MTAVTESKADVLELLNLPAPETIRDNRVRDLFTALVNQLKLGVEGNVILSNPNFLSIETEGLNQSVARWIGFQSEDDQSKLLLLSLFCQPFDPADLWPEDVPKFIDDPIVQMFFVYQDAVSLAEGKSGVPFGVDMLENRRLVQSDPGLSRLLGGIPKRRAIETISSEFIGGQPGNYEYQFWQVSEWSDNWSVVYAVTDAAHDEGYPFPWLLGFCRRDKLERNFISLLQEGSKEWDLGFYWTYGDVRGSWKLACLALRSEDDSEGPDWAVINSLQSLDDEALDQVLEEDNYGDLESVFERIKDIHYRAANIDLEELSLAELMAKAGTHFSLEETERELTSWERVHEAKEAEQRRKLRLEQQTRDEKLQSYRATIDAWVEQICGPSVRSPFGVHPQNIKRSKVGRFIENYVVEEGRLPSGKHDLGAIDGLTIGEVDFGKVANVTKL